MHDSHGYYRPLIKNESLCATVRDLEWPSKVISSISSVCLVCGLDAMNSVFISDPHAVGVSVFNNSTDRHWTPDRMIHGARQIETEGRCHSAISDVTVTVTAKTVSDRSTSRAESLASRARRRPVINCGFYRPHLDTQNCPLCANRQRDIISAEHVQWATCQLWLLCATTQACRKNLHVYI